MRLLKAFAVPILALLLLPSPSWSAPRRVHSLRPARGLRTAPPRLPAAFPAARRAKVLAAAEEPPEPHAKADLERMGAELARESAGEADPNARDLGAHFTGARQHAYGETGVAAGPGPTADGKRLLGRDEGLMSGLLSSVWILSLRGDARGPADDPELDFVFRRGIGNAVARELVLLAKAVRSPIARRDLGEIAGNLPAASAPGQGDRAYWRERLAAQTQAFQLAAERLGRLHEGAMPKSVQIMIGRKYIRGVLAGLRPAAAALAADIPVGAGRDSASLRGAARHFELRASVGLAVGLTLESLAKRYREPGLLVEVERLALLIRSAPDALEGDLKAQLILINKQQAAYQRAAEGLRALHRSF